MKPAEQRLSTCSSSRGDHRWAAALAAVLCLSARSAPASPEVILDWGMESRFGLDADGDGLIDVPNTREYVQNAAAGGSGTPRFNVTFDVGRSPYEGTVQRYVWSIRGPDTAIDADTLVPQFAPETGLPEGVYTVMVTLEGTSGPVTSRVSVPIEDLLIACLGDSYGSGEGNPDRPFPAGLSWADDGKGPEPGDAGKAHSRAHRSTGAWAAQAALEIERADPHTSVTFVFLADSGDTLRKGGFEQLEALARLVDGRRVDALLLTFGGNDIGFVEILTRLLKLSPILADLPPFLIPEVDLEFGYNYPEKLEDLWWEVGKAIRELPGSFRAFRRRLDELGINVLNTFITEYPEAGGQAIREGQVERCPRILALSCDLLAKAGQLCQGVDLPICQNLSILRDPTICSRIEGLFPDGLKLEDIIQIDEPEQAAVAERALRPLNDAVRAAAAEQGWTFVEGILRAFQDGHGVCEDDRWMRTLEDSMFLQGDVYGTLHPNQLGHGAMKRALFERLLLPVDVPELRFTDDDDQISGAQPLGTMGADALTRNASATISPASDVDVFAIDVLEAGDVSVQLSLESSAAVHALRLFDERGLELGLPSLTGELQALETARGRYYIGVSGAANLEWDPVTGWGDSAGGTVGPYTLEVRLRPIVVSPPFRRGEVNGDGHVDLSDAVFILTYLFSGGRTPGCLDAADVDDSERIDISDGIALLGFLFLGGKPPPSPGEDHCGPDPNHDGLDCSTFESCPG